MGARAILGRRKRRDPSPPDRPAPARAEAAFHLSDFLPYRLSVTTNRISRAFATLYEKEFGVSIPEWRVLAVLGSFAPISSNEVCERTQMDKAKVSRAVGRLIGGGLVVREPHRADQRLIQLQLTPEGRRIHDLIVPRARALERHLTAEFSAGELAALGIYLDRLGARLGPRQLAILAARARPGRRG